MNTSAAAIDSLSMKWLTRLCTFGCTHGRTRWSCHLCVFLQYKRRPKKKGKYFITVEQPKRLRRIEYECGRKNFVGKVLLHALDEVGGAVATDDQQNVLKIEG